MRRVSPQRCSLSKVVNLRVLRPARCIHIHLRGRVLRNLPHPATVRSAGGGENPSRMASSGTGAILRVLVVHYGEKLVSSRALPSAFATQYLSRDTAPCLACVRWCITRTRASPFPCVHFSYAPPLPRPSNAACSLIFLRASGLTPKSLSSVQP